MVKARGVRQRVPHARFCTLGVLALALALGGCPAHRSAPSVRSVVPANRQTPNAASAPRAPTRGVRFSALRDGAIVPWDWEPSLGSSASLTIGHTTKLDVRELPPFALESSHAFSVDRPHPIELTFTRSLVNESDLAHAIHVSPVVRNFKAGFSGYGTVVLDGDFVGNTRYTIQIDSSLQDRDGSAIEPTTVVVQTPSVVPTLYGDRPLVHSALPDFEDRRTFIAPLNALPFYSINHGPYRVRVHAVTPADFPAFRSRYEAVLNETEENRLPRMPGKVVFDGTVTPATLPERILETPIALAGALPGGVGHAIVEVIGAPQAPEPAPKLTYAADDPVLEYRESLSRKNHYLKWIEATNLGLSVSNRDGYGSAWVTSLDRGIPLAAKLRFGKDSAVTGAGGTASLRFGAPGDLVVATRGDDSTFVHGSFGSAPRNPLNWLLFDDKRRYREGDLVRIKGWIRGPKGDVPRAQRGAVKWNVDAEAKGSVDLDAFGSFDLSFSLPHRELPSGQSHEFVEFSYAGQIMDHEIALSVESPSRRTEYFLVGDSVTVTRTTKDKVGRGRLNVPAEWGVHVTSTWFTPPGWESFSFGNDSGDTRREQEFLQIAACGRNEEHASYFSFNSRTDASGTAAMKIDFLPQTPPQALRAPRFPRHGRS